MYSEWASLQQEIQTDSSNVSVLHKFPDGVGREVASSVVKTLARSLSMATTSDQPSNLYTDKDVQWTMEILCYSLSLPLTEGSTIIECVNVYCEWLSAFTEAKVCVPPPVRDDPNHYGQQILQHLQNLFVPRHGAVADQVNRQVVHCHRVLRVVQSVARNSTVLTRQTWDCLLKFLLAINDALLAPPAIKESLGEQICDRAISVLFEVLLLSCNKSFPSPPMWKTLRDMCAQWRHHEALIIQWHHVNLALLSHVIKFMYGPNHPQLQISEEDATLIPDSMSNECISQCWFRLLHVLSNPIDLAHPSIIANTPKFLHHALTNGIDPEQHTCLSNLPHIYQQAMRSVSVLVDAFLGLCNRNDIDLVASNMNRQTSFGHPGSTPPPQRRSKGQSGAKAPRTSNVTPTRASITSITTTSGLSPLNLDLQSSLAPSRPRVNSVLHLFGAWLMEGAMIGVKGQGTQTRDQPQLHALSRSRTTSFHVEKNPVPTNPSVRHSTHFPDEQHSAVGDDYVDRNEAGRAEACGTLCRIFCSVRTREDVLPVYLSRFYFILYHGLDVDKILSISRQQQNGQVLTSIICNSCDLLRLDLDGVMMLLPRFLGVLEAILAELNPKFKSDEHVSVIELRKAAIHLLLSMLCLPLHFKTLPIKCLFGEKYGAAPVTFLSLKMRMIELLLRALTVETDAGNTQMLLGGLLLCVHDLALCEEAEQTLDQEESDIQGAPPSPDNQGAALVTPDVTEMNGQRTAEVTPQSRSTKDWDSAQGLFCHAASIVSNRLLASWKSDLNIALAAIEVLSGLAKVRLNRTNFLMGKRTVNWICEFILYQCSRPAPSHSKDLHSMIVAAFHCLSIWLVEHSYLLHDKECLQGVLEVLELGISGAKSQPEEDYTGRGGVMEQPPSPRSPTLRRHSPGSSRKAGKQDRDSVASRDIVDRVVTQNRASDVPHLKGDKELKPVSLRVKDAAEGLLTSIMDHVGSFPPPCGPESLCSLMDEGSLLQYCKGATPDNTGHFRYFVLERSTIIALYEQPLGNNQDPLPTVTALVRGPFGRHAWTMQLRHQPRHKKSTTKTPISEVPRPQPLDVQMAPHNIKQTYFPDEVHAVPLLQVDQSIPQLEDTLQEEASNIDKMKSIIEQQVKFENSVQDKFEESSKNMPFPNPDTQCTAPRVSDDLQTARLFLSHYGFLTLDALKSPANTSRPPSLVMLNSTMTGFLPDLEALDMIPSRTADTVHIFYVKSGQTQPRDILNNVISKKSVMPVFLEFLRCLGWPVDVKRHAGWTGHVSTSWRIQGDLSQPGEVYQGDTGGSLYDGQKQVLYWADVSTEVAVVVPSPDTYSQCLERNTSGDTKSLKENGSHSSLEAAAGIKSSPRQSDARPSRLKSMSLDLEQPRDHPGGLRSMTPTESTVSSRRIGRSGSHSNMETKVFVVWLESYEDWQNFPSGDLLPVTSTGLDTAAASSSVSSNRQVEPAIYIIYIHALQNGLYRIHMHGQVGKMALAIPLVDGMVTSRRTLGPLVRQTAINICRRKRLECDSYQPPHVRRKIKIKDIVDKYTHDTTEAEFYTALFKSAVT